MTVHTGKTRKAYAAEQNWCSPGKGRMSREVLAKIAELEEQGYVFTDTAKYAVRVDNDGKEKTVKVEVNLHAATPEPIHRNRQWKVNVNGKVHKISEATVCMDCRVSLPWQPCTTPPVVTKWGVQKAYYDYAQAE